MEETFANLTTLSEYLGIASSTIWESLLVAGKLQAYQGMLFGPIFLGLSIFLWLRGKQIVKLLNNEEGLLANKNWHSTQRDAAGVALAFCYIGAIITSMLAAGFLAESLYIFAPEAYAAKQIINMLPN